MLFVDLESLPISLPFPKQSYNKIHNVIGWLGGGEFGILTFGTIIQYLEQMGIQLLRCFSKYNTHDNIMGGGNKI